MKLWPNLARRGSLALLCIALAAPATITVAQDTSSFLGESPPNADEVWRHFYEGEFDKAIATAAANRDSGGWMNVWDRIIAESLLAQGRYEEAYEELQRAVAAWPYELRFRLLLREAARHSGHSSVAKAQLEEIAFRVNSNPRRYFYNSENVVAIGEAALELGMEPKVVLDSFFKRVQADPTPPVSAFLASGKLAFNKRDFALASRQFQEGIKRYERNPYLWSALASCFREGDRSKLIEYAQKALEIDERHVPALLLLAEHMVDAEDYDGALAQLDLVSEVNPFHPQGLALQAAVYLLRHDEQAAEALREQALSGWQDNPLVDHTIGRKLSQNYWFSEGAAYQRKALALDDSYTPARVQLAQDLLRLGREREGWELAARVHEDDPYDISAFNLVTLHDKLDTFTRLESKRFLARMEPTEAEIYGERALELLDKAYETLSAKYGVTLPQKTLVEIFPNPADFETRTFGMPGNPGYLGVCFGPVFTINSPATRSANWEAVLYHEFCHSITLALSRNRMPRWLSEGISVYEEEQANPTWGRRMTANFRDRILAGELRSIGDMSAAFMTARSGDDTQYAYFQSTLAVKYLYSNYGLDAMRELLEDLGRGVSINEAFARRMAPIETLDTGFFAFARAEAARLAPGFIFADTPPDTVQPLPGYSAPINYDERLAEGSRLLEQKNWAAAADQLQALVEQAGYIPEDRNAHMLLAHACRELGDVELERELLREVAAQEAHRLGPVSRLLEIAVEQKDHASTLRWSNAWLAINPMATTPQRANYNAARELGLQRDLARAGASLIALGATDAPAIHFEIAQRMKDTDPVAARRHTLLALETAPRFREAYQLLDSLPPAKPPANESQELKATLPDQLMQMLDTSNPF